MNNNHYSFPGKAVDMLMVTRTIAGSFKENIGELSAIRSDWTPVYADELIKRIDDAMAKYLGIDSRKDLRAATHALTTLQEPALKDLVFFKTQVIDDFRGDPSRRDEILKLLGFIQFPPHLQNVNHEVLIELLFAFRNNLTPDLRAEIIAKGTKEELIDRILSYADAMVSANITRETFKSSWHEVSHEVRDAYNAIYEEVIGICKKCSVHYHDNLLKRHLFTYSHVLDNLGNGGHSTATEQPAAPPPPSTAPES
jgi:hypothetical protein